MAGETELGPAVGSYRTSTRRRGWAAVILLAAGAALAVPGVALWVIADEMSRRVRTAADPVVVPSVLIGLAIGCLGGAVAFGVWAFRHRGEVFELHDHGVRLVVAGRSRAVPWAEIGQVVHGQVKDTAFTRLAGGDFHCVVHLTDGEKFVITGLTEQARQLVAHLETATAS